MIPNHEFWLDLPAKVKVEKYFYNRITKVL